MKISVSVIASKEGGACDNVILLATSTFVIGDVNAPVILFLFIVIYIYLHMHNCPRICGCPIVSQEEHESFL